MALVAHRRPQRVGIGDLSRPTGGSFGARFGGLGHLSHQNGLDVDVYYPRLERAMAPPDGVAQVDRGLAQDLVNRFVAELKEIRQPPSRGARRLNLLYAAQVATRPPRFRFTVNDTGLDSASATATSSTPAPR
mgnify:CR=1 FL=1